MVGGQRLGRHARDGRREERLQARAAVLIYSVKLHTTVPTQPLCLGRPTVIKHAACMWKSHACEQPGRMRAGRTGPHGGRRGGRPLRFDQANGEPLVERSAHKWARDGKVRVPLPHLLCYCSQATHPGEHK